jgi:DNA (cytosine-5)-methyltransferase 1
VGVDLEYQPQYPYTFFQGNALAILDALLAGKSLLSLTHGRLTLDSFAAFGASPPCQKFAMMSNCRPGLRETYPDLIPDTRERLRATGKPYVIENVPGAPLETTLTLCGTMFGKRLRLHRNFETNFPVQAPAPCDHSGYVLNPHSVEGRRRMREEFGPGLGEGPWRAEKGIPWITGKAQSREAIMPAYTEYIGLHMLHGAFEEAA